MDQLAVSIPTDHDAYDTILQMFVEELKQQNLKTAFDLIEGQPAAPLRIPLWSWDDRLDEVMRICNAACADDSHGSMYFPWPAVANHLGLAWATITSREIELRTTCPPVQDFPAFARAVRRVYLTATLSDDGDLVSAFAANASEVQRPITPERASDLGDRLILAPQALNPGLPEDDVRSLVRDLSAGLAADGTPTHDPVNAVVLVPSRRAAEKWQAFADETVDVAQMAPVVKRLVSGEHVGVVVLVNKYDGVDLPAEACRILVIDGVPTPLRPYEAREAAALGGSQRFLARRVQRIEQGMGRGIRDAQDYCCVLLMGSEIALALEDVSSRRLFSPATQAQIEISRQVGEQLNLNPPIWWGGGAA